MFDNGFALASVSDACVSVRVSG